MAGGCFVIWGGDKGSPEAIPSCLSNRNTASAAFLAVIFPGYVGISQK